MALACLPRLARAALPLAALLPALVPAAGAGQRASASCQARQAGDRVLVTLELRHFLDEESRRLLELGMTGRIRAEAVLVRKRLGLFEQTLATAVEERRLSSSRGTPSLLLDERPLRDATGTQIHLERLALRLPAGGARTSGLALRVSVSMRVVTLSSLSKVAAWATESNEEDASSSLLTRGLLSAVVADLTRSADCGCPVPAP